MTISTWSQLTTAPMTIRMRHTSINKRIASILRSIDQKPPTPVRLLNVLVVDDDRDTTDSLTMLLQLWGHNVRSSYGGGQALELAMIQRPDVLLLDVGMPLMNGCELTRRLRGEPWFERTRIIAISGYVDEAHQQLCRRAGFDDFFGKPLELAVLQNLLTDEQRRRTKAVLPVRVTAPSEGLSGLYRTSESDANVGVNTPREMKQIW